MEFQQNKDHHLNLEHGNQEIATMTKSNSESIIETFSGSRKVKTHRVETSTLTKSGDFSTPFSIKTHKHHRIRVRANLHKVA